MTDNIIHLPLKMPPELATQVTVLSSPPNPEYAELAPLEPVHDPAAGEWLRRKRDMIRQSSREDCHGWMVLLGLGINGITEEALARREVAVWSMCRDLPDLVWCEATMQAMWKRTPFLPSPGECREVLEAHVAPILREIEALERIAQTPPPKPRTKAPPYVPPPAPEWATGGPAHSLRKPFAPGQTAAEVTASLGAALKSGPQTDAALIRPHPQVRTVEEQIAALKADAPDPPEAAD